MRRVSRSLTLLLASMVASCAILRPAPALFPPSERVERLDFEGDVLARPPSGLEPRLGSWSVADSPTAASGTQVVVRHGDTPARLTVTGATRARRIGAEVALRVLLGAPGAGLACDAGEGNGYVLKLEPDAGRVALYRRADDALRLVGSGASPLAKGAWTRVGIFCGPDLVVGYLDGKPVARDLGLGDPADLALYADAGVTAQFDDLRYAARDGQTRPTATARE